MKPWREITDLFREIEIIYGHKPLYAEFLKELLSLCIRFKEQGVEVPAMLSLIDSFIKILELSH
jgi:hypothetical protein